MSLRRPPSWLAGFVAGALAADCLLAGWLRCRGLGGRLLGASLAWCGRDLGGGLRARGFAAAAFAAGVALGLAGALVPLAAFGAGGSLGPGGLAERGARALPAAVWAPLALPALPSAIRVLAALAAAALPVVLVTLAVVWTWAPPRAALTLRVSRDLRRAAALGWIAPALAARSSELNAAARASAGSPSSSPEATRTAFAVMVLATLRRGWLISVRRSAVRTRFRADGVLAPVQPRGLVAKSEPRWTVRMMGAGGTARRGTPMVADERRTDQRRRAAEPGRAEADFGP